MRVSDRSRICLSEYWLRCEFRKFLIFSFLLSTSSNDCLFSKATRKWKGVHKRKKGYFIQYSRWLIHLWTLKGLVVLIEKQISRVPLIQVCILLGLSVTNVLRIIPIFILTVGSAGWLMRVTCLHFWRSLSKWAFQEDWFQFLGIYLLFCFLELCTWETSEI